MSRLVTGAGGQLGREWVRFLHERGESFQARSSRELDITDAEQIERQLDRLHPEVVINCAAWTDVDGAESDRQEAMKVNAEGVAHLAGWCERNGALLVHYSTDYIFPGDPGDQSRFPSGYPEDAPPSPVNAYGVSKLAGEKALLDSGAEHLLVRTSWLCGGYGENFVTLMLRLGRNRRVVEVVDDQFGSPSFTSSVVGTTDQLLRRNARGIFHIASEGIISRYRFAEEIFRMAGVDVTIRPVGSNQFPASARRPAFSALDTSKAAALLGRPMERWEEGLKELLDQLTAIRSDEDSTDRV